MSEPALGGLIRGLITFGLPGPGAQLSDHLRSVHAGAAGTAGSGDPAAPLDDQSWRALLFEVTRHRVPGLLLAAIESGVLPTTEEQREMAEQRHLEACSSVLGLERRLLEYVELLEAAGIYVVVLKGSAHAHLLERDPALRHFGDVDLLVPSRQLELAVEVLGDHRGAVRTVPELRPGFDRRFAKSVTLRDPVGVEIDLHRNLLFGTFGFAIDEAQLFADTVGFELGGRTLRALAPEARLLHVSYHAGLGDKRPRGNSMRDLLAAWLIGDYHEDRLAELAGRWRSEAVLARGLHLCRDVLGVEVPGTFATELRDRVPTVEERRAIDSYVGENGSHAAKVRASMPFISGLRDQVAFLTASLVPSEGFLSRSRTGRGTWLRRGWRSWRR